MISGFDDMMHMSDIPPGMGGPPNMHGGFDHGGMGPSDMIIMTFSPWKSLQAENLNYRT